MLCRKFELIPTSIFQVMAILRKCQNSQKYPVLYIAHAFFQKIAPKSTKIFITFSDTYWCPYINYAKKSIVKVVILPLANYLIKLALGSIYSVPYNTICTLNVLCPYIDIKMREKLIS